MVAQEDLNLFSCHGHTQSTGTYGIIPTEKELKTASAVPSTTKDKRTTSREAREAKMQSCQKHNTWCCDAQQGRRLWVWSSSPRREEFVPHQSPQLSGPAPERGGPQSMWLWKSVDFRPGDPGGRGYLRYSLRGLCVDTYLGTLFKCISLNDDRSVHEKASSADLEMSVGGAATSWDFLWVQRHWRAPFCALLITCQHR